MAMRRDNRCRFPMCFDGRSEASMVLIMLRQVRARVMLTVLGAVSSSSAVHGGKAHWWKRGDVLILVLRPRRSRLTSAPACAGRLPRLFLPAGHDIAPSWIRGSGTQRDKGGAARYGSARAREAALTRGGGAEAAWRRRWPGCRAEARAVPWVTGARWRWRAVW